MQGCWAAKELECHSGCAENNLCSYFNFRIYLQALQVDWKPSVNEGWPKVKGYFNHGYMKGKVSQKVVLKEVWYFFCYINTLFQFGVMFILHAKVNHAENSMKSVH